MTKDRNNVTNFRRVKKPFPRSRLRGLLAGMLGAILILMSVFAFLKNVDHPNNVTITSKLGVVDGDTLKYQGKRLRLLGIDTPEPSKYGNAECWKEAQLGDKATEFTKAAVTSKEVTIEWSGHSDKYDRELVRIRIDGEFLSDQLIAAGLGRKWKGRQVDWCRILK